MIKPLELMFVSLAATRRVSAVARQLLSLYILSFSRENESPSRRRFQSRQTLAGIRPSITTVY